MAASTESARRTPVEAVVLQVAESDRATATVDSESDEEVAPVLKI